MINKTTMVLVFLIFGLLSDVCLGRGDALSFSQETGLNSAGTLASDIGDLRYVGHFQISASEQSEIREMLAQKNRIQQVPSLNELSRLNISPLGNKIIYLEGHSRINDGGQGYLLIEAISSENKDEKVDNLLVYRSKENEFYFKRIHSGQINMKLGGAKGDGIADDTDAIQKVLDTRMDVYVDSSDDLYRVGPSEKDPDIFYPYKTALILYGGQSINLSGATLKLSDSCNCSVFINEALYRKGATDSGITIHGGTIDGNVDNQKVTGISNGDQFSPTVYMGNIENTSFYDLKIKNYYGSGLYISGRNKQAVKHIKLENITVNRGKGPGISVSGEYVTGTDIQISNTESFMENGSPKYYWGAHPNAIVLAVDNSSFGKIRFKNCSWGFKLQDGSKNVSFKKIVADGVLNGQAVKFQGKKAEDFYHYNDNIKVGEIVSKNNNYNGLYIIYTQQIDIGSYIGINNGQAYLKNDDNWHRDSQNFYDVWIRWSNVSIDRLESTNARIGVIDSREMFAPGDNDRQFGVVIVKGLQEGYVAKFINASHTVQEIIVTANASHDGPLVYMEGGETASNDIITVLESVTSNQGMTFCEKPFYVHRIGQGVFFQNSYTKLGDNQSISVINNEYKSGNSHLLDGPFRFICDTSLLIKKARTVLQRKLQH